MRFHKLTSSSHVNNSLSMKPSYSFLLATLLEGEQHTLDCNNICGKMKEHFMVYLT